MTEQYKRYEHPVYKPGMQIYVDPAIRRIHSKHKAAGCIVTVTLGPDYSKTLTSEQLRLMRELREDPGEDQGKVPVSLSGGCEFELEVESEA